MRETKNQPRRFARLSGGFPSGSRRAAARASQIRTFAVRHEKICALSPTRWFWHRPNGLRRNTMLRHAAVFAGSALRGGSRIASEARQLQQIRYLNVHEYQVRPSRPSSLQIASLLNVTH